MSRRRRDRQRRRMWFAIVTGVLVVGAAVGVRLAKGRDREPTLEPPPDATP